MSLFIIKQVCDTLKKLRLVEPIIIQSRSRSELRAAPQYRPPRWFIRKNRVISDEKLTLENQQFLEEFKQDTLELNNEKFSPLLQSDFKSKAVWNPHIRRVGVIAKKIGNYPMWLKNGKRVQTTLLQVVDNHVIKYIPPAEFNPISVRKRQWKSHHTLGSLLVGAETIDPSTVTKGYCGLFNRVGMLPKQTLCRFMVSPKAALPTGTPLYATHFRVGDYVDIRAKTIDRGFQGVIKRWGFKGMPASHGVTKTHRRPGNIGSGGNKARVWPGQKMPGHMGNKMRILRGVKILRINTEYNVLWVLGVAIPGETGAICNIFDTVLPLRRPTTAPPFPTQSYSTDLPIEYYDESVHSFDDPTIAYDEA